MMNEKERKIINYYLVSILISAILIIIFMNYDLWTDIIQEEYEREITDIRTVDFKKDEIFKIMTDAESYPIVLSENIISIKITNQTINSYELESKIQEKGIKMNLNTKHEIESTDKFFIKILDGDAENTTIKQTFIESGNSTTITTEFNFHLRGILKSVAFIPENILREKIDSVMNSFIEYGKQR
jgi:ribosome-associated toxin RatA of RatAB toxin-antitoxin module